MEMNYGFDPDLVTIEDCQEMNDLKDYGSVLNDGHWIMFIYNKDEVYYEKT